METIIKLENIGKVYSTGKIETHALSKINLDIKRGDFVSVMGPSGCGKSTLLNIMGLLDTPSSGQVMLEDSTPNYKNDKILSRFRNAKIGLIFQNFHLIKDLNVLYNVELPLLYRQKVSAATRRERAKAILETVGLSARISHYPAQLSGGQRQRVAIARALAGEPSILLADEPTGNLDSKMGSEIMDLLHEVNKSGTTIVMVTHDERLAKQTDQIIRIFDGERVE